MSGKVLHIDAADDVVVALQDLAAGETVRIHDQDLTLATPVRAKHKFARRYLSAGEAVRMYGVVVGRAAVPVEPGVVLSPENLVHETEPYVVRASAGAWRAPDAARWQALYDSACAIGTRP